ncbi:hypothetical protein BC628DRAFT_1335950 [Trametes gibbosa]|nr:hypothetical protein BC628DRAFT_1335950 [Trametes gibbosa]
MSSSFAAATGVLTPLEIALKESLLLPDFRDVHLYAFSKRTINRNESNDPETANAQIPTVIRLEALEGEYDYESDSDLDEEEDIIQDVSGSEDDASTGRPQLSKGKLKEEHLRACVFYLYTGKLNFRPFRPPTSWEPPPETFVESQAPSCSPKSMFRLAESYGMTKLQGVAYDAIIENLTSSNIVDQAFSSFFWR